MLIKLPSGKFQAKVRGADGQWISKAFPNRKEAQAFEAGVKKKLLEGAQTTNEMRSMTVDSYFERWFEVVQTRASQGWRNEQLRNYRVFVSPILGNRKILFVTPQLVARILNDMSKKGKSEQTQLHVFALLRKMFGDAIELFRILTFNPAQKSLKPKVPVKESPHLNITQTRNLLEYAKSKPYGEAIWVQLFLGLRIGELQALTWNDVDLETGTVHIRRAYVRKERCIRQYPKGKKHHTQKLPPELRELLSSMKETSKEDFVVTAASGGMLLYEWYFRTLRRYCRELKLPIIGTHGLRHSTSELYLSHGASQDDIRQLFAHSSSVVTERYIHHRDSRLEKVTNVIQLFPKRSTDPREDVKTGSENG